MTRLKLVVVAVTVAGAVGGLAACGGGGGGTTGTLTVGDLVPLTGDLSDFGPPGEKAASLAADQINEAAKKVDADISGVKVVTEDTQTEPGASVQAARKVTDEGATCIAGAWASADTIPVARSVSIPDEILQISPASTSDEITGLDDNGLINRTSPPDSFQGPTLSDAIEKDLGSAKGNTVNIGARNDSYGTGLADTFSTAWEDAGGKIGQKVIYDPKAASYDSEARKIVSGNPDAIVIIDFPETFVKVGPALARTGSWDPTKAWGTDGLDVEQPAEGRRRGRRQGHAGHGARHPRQGSDHEGVRRAVHLVAAEERGSPDVRRPEFRRRCALLSGGGRRGVD